ncbi:MAG: serine/threonine-protein phosphatase [Phycisphaerales bacterium]|nr:serine/threonine-protein phosphatase [Phycisphaerales bacterium]
MPASPMPPVERASSMHTMQCMEVWGGNHAADNGVVMPGLSAWVFSRPYHDQAAGGDVHYVSSCGTGRIARVVLADVSGHGEQVAGIARRLQRLMRRYINYLDQTTFVQALNREFSSDESTRFATSLTITYFGPSHTLDVCNAGHPRPLWYRAQQRRWELLVPPPAGAREAESAEVRNLPLGVLEPTRYEQFGIRLRPGDMVLLYTDGVTESRSPTGELLGEPGLIEMVASIDAGQPGDLVNALVERLANWRGQREGDDDLTILLLHHDGRAVMAPLHKRLLASLRMLGIMARHLVPFGDRPPVPWPEWRRENLLGAFRAAGK